MKLVQQKFPVCTIVDGRGFKDVDIAEKCHQKPRDLELGKDGMYKVTICTGQFNVYILDIKE